MKITRLRANHLITPLGFSLEPLSLSWIPVAEEKDGDAQRTASVRIIISKNSDLSNPVYDSGLLSEKKADSLGFVPPISLSPRTRYYWNVAVTANNGASAVSEISWFETGKMSEPWTAPWITPNLEPEVHPLLRKGFSLPGEIVNARIYICGLGVYELYVNGQKAGNEFLAPGYHNYTGWLQTQTYDVTGLLQPGGNAIGVMLGNGWYKGRFGFEKNAANMFGNRFALCCELIATLKNGDTIRIETDDNWRCHASPVLESSIYNGEVFDAKMAQTLTNWSEFTCDDTLPAWTTVRFYTFPEKTGPRRDRLSPPVIEQERIAPIELLITPTGESVLDFGQNMTGWVEIQLNEQMPLPENGRLELAYGEILQHNCFYQENLRSAQQQYVYLGDGQSALVRPHFTYYGFRYVRIKGLKEVRPEYFTAVVLHSDLPQTGYIETGHSLINQLFHNTLWSQKSNFLDVPTDCPQRDERMGWTGDAQVFSATANFNMYCPAFYTKYMQDMFLEQETLHGSVPDVVPHTQRPDGTMSCGHGACGWADAAAIIPWTLYQFYGDRSLLEQQYKNMKNWVDSLCDLDHKNGGKRLWQTGFHYADWLALDNYSDPASSFGGTDCYLIASAYYYRSVLYTAKAARELNKINDTAYYGNLADQIKFAFQQEYFTPSGRCAVDTQTALALVLQFDLVPAAYRKRVQDRLKEKLRMNHMALTTGFLGTPCLLFALTEGKAPEYAYHLLLREEYPSWLYEIKMGATTIWERWNSLLPDGSVSDTGMNSLNHYAYGAVTEWIYRYVCGLNPMESCPGFRKILLRPIPNFKLKYAKTVFEGPAGHIESGWIISEDAKRVTYTFVIPFSCTAKVVLQGAAPQQIAVNGRPLSHGERLSGGVSFTLETGKWTVTCPYVSLPENFSYEPFKFLSE